MKPFALLLASVSLFAVSCERHEFEGPDGTKQLHEQHHAASGKHETHGAPAKDGEHSEKPAH